MKKFVVLWFAIVALVFVVTAATMGLVVMLQDPDPTVVRIEGSIDGDTITAVEKAISEARKLKSPALQVIIRSPGGPVLAAVEVARLLRKASDEDLIVKTHGQTLVASGATLVLAAGTPGHRTIDGEAFVLFHGIQLGSMFGSSCVNPSFPEVTEDDKALNAIHNILASAFARYTGLPYMTVVDMMTCGKEMAGAGLIAVQRRIADTVVGHVVLPVALPQFVKTEEKKDAERPVDSWKELR